MASSISTVRAREGLKVQHDPHWMKLAAGAYLGFRKMTPGSVGTWMARYRDPETKVTTKVSLGDFEQMPPSQRFDAAKREAEHWFAHLGKGGSATATTVKSACEAYVKHLRDTKGDKAADDIDARFRRWVYGNADLARTDLSKLTRTKVEGWRKSLSKTAVKVNRDNRAEPVTRPRSPGSVNRDCTALRAALNYAHDLGHVTTDLPWRVALRPTKNADKRREVYLDRNQRRTLIDKAQPDVANLLRALSMLPLRPGALAGLTVADFDKRLRTLRIGKDKTGADRRITLPASIAAFLAEQAKGKLPAAPLLARADGKAWDKDAWKNPIKEAAAGLPEGTTAYALRHSTITDLVTAGLPLLTVAQLSGTSVAMIERHYGHLQASQAADALAALVL